MRPEAESVRPKEEAVQEVPFKIPTTQDLQDILTKTGTATFQELRELVQQVRFGSHIPPANCEYCLIPAL